jgi:hypothetical protein
VGVPHLPETSVGYVLCWRVRTGLETLAGFSAMGLVRGIVPQVALAGTPRIPVVTERDAVRLGNATRGRGCCANV